jgi:hypothetical protein
MRLTHEATGRILDSGKYGVAGPMRLNYYSFGLKMRGILNHGGGRAEIDNAIKEYLQRISNVNPNILRSIANMQGKSATGQRSS